MDAKEHAVGGSGGRRDRHVEFDHIERDVPKRLKWKAQGNALGLGPANLSPVRAKRLRCAPSGLVVQVDSNPRRCLGLLNGAPSGRRNNSLTPDGSRPDRHVEEMVGGTTADTGGGRVPSDVGQRCPR